MRRFWIVLITVLIVSAGVLMPRESTALALSHTDAASAKKCKKGQHRVHGKCKRKQSVAPTPIPTIAYVAIGDSFTHGSGANDPSTQSYPALLAKHLTPGVGLLNLGDPGATTSDGLNYQLPRALSAHPSLATVWLGTNDVREGSCPVPPSACAVEAATVGTTLGGILSALQTAHVRVFVANLPDFHVLPITAGGDPQYCAGQCWVPGTAINSAIAAVAARYGDPVIDVHSGSKSLWGRPEFVSGDGIHLTTAGYAALANLFYSVMHAQGAL